MVKLSKREFDGAVSRNYIDIVKLLLKKDADINAK